MDLPILISAGLLIVLSFLMIYSATFPLQQKLHSDPQFYVKRQATSLLFGIIAFLIFIYFDYRHWERLANPLYILMLFLLMAVLFVGYTAYGAQRWLGVGFLSLQPSELAKLIMVLVLAKYFVARLGQHYNLVDMLVPFLVVFIPFLLVFKQPDLGTALVFMAILLGLSLWGGVSSLLIVLALSPLLSLFIRSLGGWIWLGYTAGVGILMLNYRYIKLKLTDAVVFFSANVVAGLALSYIWGMLKVYQQKRILAFFNPEIDPLGAGYHALQSKIAIGSGGFFGKGLFQGTQTRLQFIPQQQTDFIFSVVGEELGFLGCLLVVGLFSIIIWRAVRIAATARDPFGSLVAGGIAVIFLFQLLVNVGMTIGLMPVVGIPLPLMSFGGSSLILNLINLGILESIAMRRQKILF